MKKKIFIALAVLAIIGISVALYMFNMPHRDVNAAKADFTVTSSTLVKEFIDNSAEANTKYLAEDGESKILEISGRVDKINEDKAGQKVVMLKSQNDKMGVSATFTSETNAQLSGVSVGDNISIKGVVRSGAEYDEDLDLFEDVIVEKASLVK